MRHRRTFRKSRGKTSIKHGSTLVDNTGPGVGSFFVHRIYNVQAADRVAAGSPTNIQATQSTDETTMVGSQVYYANVCLQCSPRGAEPTNVLDNAGWLEWAVYWTRENDTDLLVTNIGTEMLGVLNGRTFRQDAIMSGCFPIGTRQAMSQDIKIKIPSRCCTLRQGDKLKIACYVRTSLSTDTRTDSHRLIASSQYKSYN